MPHQQLIADVALEVDPDTGLLAFSEVVVIGPRQATGKTELMLPVMTHRCVGFDEALTRWVRDELGLTVPVPGPQRVLYTAQTADSARQKWRDIHLERLRGSPFRREFSYRLRLNQEAMVWRSKSMWSPGSTTGRTSGTGDTLDLGVIDEAWSRPNARTELGMRPAMMTRDWRQLWILSMIPGLSRARPDQWPYLRAKRQLGRQRVAAGVRNGMAFFDFTAPPAEAGTDPADPATWYASMPGLGRTVAERVVAEDFDAMDLVDFCAEYLGWEPVESTPQWTLVSQLTWDERYDPASCVAGRPALAVEMNEERDRGWIGVAGYRDDGQYHVEIVEPGGRVPVGAVGVEWIERRAVEMVADHQPWTVVVDPRRPAASLIQPLKNRGIDVLTPAQPDIAGACGRFFDATGEVRPGRDFDDGLRLHHLGQQVLDRAVGQARRLDLGAGSFVFVKKGSSSELGPLYTVTLALLGLVVKGSEVTPEPDIFV
jgi:hypothetical protein